MWMRAAVILTWVLVMTLAAAGCRSEGSENGSKGEAIIGSGPESPTATAEPEEECLDAINDYYPPEGGPITLEESIIWSDTVARVRLLSFAGGVEGPDSGDWYAPSFEFTFKVMEYLKGDGGDELMAVASGVPGGLIPGCDASAKAEMQRLLPGRDTRWDNLEAIVFLNGQFYEDEHRYRLGYIQQGGQSGYTVDSPYKRAWLPEAPSTGMSGEADQRFLLSAPAFDQSASGQIDALLDEPTIELNEIKLMIARLDSELAAGGGSDLYRHCMYNRYSIPRILRWELEKEGSLVRRRSYYVDSGLSAGNTIWEDEFGIGLPPDKFGRYWLEGQDKDLFTIEAFNPIPVTWPMSIPGDLINYSRKVTTTRPLPAGDYEFFFNGFPAYLLLCDVPQEIERNLNSEHVKVSAPEGTVYEAFFDPVGLGSGVGVNDMPGTLMVDGESTRISSLQWRTGLVVLTLSPYVFLADHKLDFIELDGSVGISLEVFSARESNEDGTLTWDVAEQPWKYGDKLMLRIRE